MFDSKSSSSSENDSFRNRLIKQLSSTIRSILHKSVNYKNDELAYRNKKYFPGSSAREYSDVDQSYIPQGIMGVLKISLKRYLFNFLDRSPRNWAKAVSVSEPGDRRGLYVSSASVTFNQNVSKFWLTPRSPKKLRSRPRLPKKMLTSVGNVFARSKKFMMNRLGRQNDEMDLDDYNDQNEYENDEYDDDDDFSDDEVRIFANSDTYSSENRARTRGKRKVLSVPFMSEVVGIELPDISLRRTLSSLTRIPSKLNRLRKAAGSFIFDSGEQSYESPPRQGSRYIRDSVESSFSSSSSSSYSSSEISNNQGPIFFDAQLRSFSEAQVNKPRITVVSPEEPSNRRNKVPKRENKEIRVELTSGEGLGISSNRSIRKLQPIDARRPQLALAAAAQPVQEPHKLGQDTYSTRRGYEPNKTPGIEDVSSDLNRPFWSGATDAAAGVIGTVVNTVSSVRPPSLPTFSMPWDVHYRAAIPFFENALNSIESDVIDDVKVKENLVAQVMASDAADALHSGLIVQPLPRESFNVVDRRPKPSTTSVVSTTTSLSPTSSSPSPSPTHEQHKVIKLAGKVAESIFPLITRAVQLTEGLRHRTSSESDNKIPTTPTNDISFLVDSASDADSSWDGSLIKSSVHPGDGVGLGLGMDPEEVMVARLNEEQMIRDSKIDDYDEATLSGSTDHKHNPSLLTRIYRYTTKLIVRAPRRLVHWTKEKLFHSHVADMKEPVSSTPFDEETEGIRQDLRQAVRNKQVLPASVLDNLALDEYNPAANSSNLLTSVRLDSRNNGVKVDQPQNMIRTARNEKFNVSTCICRETLHFVMIYNLYE